MKILYSRATRPVTRRVNAQRLTYPTISNNRSGGGTGGLGFAISASITGLTGAAVFGSPDVSNAV